MLNADLRLEMMQRDITLTEVAERLNMKLPNLSALMRRELTPQKRQLIADAIQTIDHERRNRRYAH